MTTRSQRTANQLIAAERALSEAQDQYIAAKRIWTDAIRGRPTDEPIDPPTAQARLDSALAQRERAAARIEELRRTLNEQRRREILMGAVVEQGSAHDAARRRLDEHNGRRSVWARLFRR